VALQVDELLELVKLTVHLQDADFLAIVGIWSIVHLDAWEAASEFTSTWNPADSRSFIKQVGWVEQLLSFLLDETYAKDLALLLVWHELSWENLNDDISLLFLWVNVSIEIWLSGIDRGLDGLQRMSTLSHITLNLPGEFNLIGDVQVDAEIDQVIHAIIIEWVKSFNDQDLWSLGFLSWIQKTSDVIVDWLIDSLSALESFDLRMSNTL
jgi:hypothetical protein